MAITTKGKRWEILHSLWIGWAFTFGFFNWVGFLYIGYRAKQRKWILWGLLYSVPFVSGMLLTSAGALQGWALNLNTFLVVALGVVGIFHAFKVRKEYLLRLEGARSRTAQRDSTLKRKIGEEYMGDTEKIHSSQSTATPESVDSGASARAPESPTIPPGNSVNTSPTIAPRPTFVGIDETPRRVSDSSLSTSPISLAQYPIPLSYSYRLVEAEFESLRVLKEVYRSAEGLTAFLASLGIALIDAPISNSTKKKLRKDWGGRGATFGVWFSILERTTQLVDKDKGPLYSSLGRLLGTQTKPSSFAESMHWLIDQRNELHHSDLPVGSATERLIHEARTQLDQCILETAPLWEYPLRLVLDYDAIRDSEYVMATCLDYSGDHPAGRKVKEEYRGIPKKQDLYILQSREEWIPLYPFISVHYCHHCNARETYFIDSWGGSGEEANLRSFERAHEEVSQDIGQALSRWLG